MTTTIDTLPLSVTVIHTIEFSRCMDVLDNATGQQLQRVFMDYHTRSIPRDAWIDFDYHKESRIMFVEPSGFLLNICSCIKRVSLLN